MHIIVITLHRDLNNSVAFIFKQLIRLVDRRQRIGMRDQRLGIELAVANTLQLFYKSYVFDEPFENTILDKYSLLLIYLNVSSNLL